MYEINYDKNLFQAVAFFVENYEKQNNYNRY